MNVPGQAPPPVVYVSFCADVNPTTSEGLIAACANLANQRVQEIRILLSTPGGSVDGGITIFNMLRALPCRIVTHNVGSVNSIGNVVFLAGEKRYANPGTTFMFHGVGFDVGNCRLEEKILRERLDSLLADQKKIADIIRSRADFKNPSEVDELFRQASTRDAEFAQSHGIVHEICEAKVPFGAPILQLVFQR